MALTESTMLELGTIAPDFVLTDVVSEKTVRRDDFRGKQAVKMTRLSCHRFQGNEVRLWLRILAYNMGNLWRRLVLPKGIEDWSLTSLQQRLVKTGGRLVKHARYYWMVLAEGHLTRTRFSAMLRRIALLPLPAN